MGFKENAIFVNLSYWRHKHPVYTQLPSFGKETETRLQQMENSIRINTASRNYENDDF